tara:strand:+ start:103 stop:885 length:783 start_codon:yes stop_codon:yes gene_type:complete
MGWGVQTWTLAAMMALDEHPRPDHIVFADTHHEGQATYAFAQKWTPWLGERGLDVVTVEAVNTEVGRGDWGRGGIQIPAYTLNRETGKHGQAQRQCTHDWKITPIRRFIRTQLKIQGIQRRAGVVETWQGISWDEALRMRTSDVQYIKNVYPLVDLRMTRRDCYLWLEKHGLPAAPKSACTFCPFKSTTAWKNLKRQGGHDWAEAVEVDASIRRRESSLLGWVYIHRACKPLPEAVTIPEDEGAYQIEMDIGCEGGYCMT